MPKIAAVTIGQTPRTDITNDIINIIPKNVELVEYGALDNYTYDEICEKFAPVLGFEILVSRMRDGRQVKFSEKYITPLIQECINKAEKDGADLIILFCTGFFPDFSYKTILLKPQPIFHSIVSKIAGKKNIGIMVPEQDQLKQAYELWNKSGISIYAASASPYNDIKYIEEAAKQFKNKNLSFICLDCMGYGIDIKHKVEEITGIPVILPRTLITTIAVQFFI